VTSENDGNVFASIWPKPSAAEAAFENTIIAEAVARRDALERGIIDLGANATEDDVKKFREYYEREIAGARDVVIMSGSEFVRQTKPPSFGAAIAQMVGALAAYALFTTLVRFAFSPLSQGGAIVRLPPYGNDKPALFAMLLPPTQDQLMNDALADDEVRVGRQTSR
jgi:hypothetical protein